MIVDRQYMGVFKWKCIVWGVVFLFDGIVISVDFVGKVQFWDLVIGMFVKSYFIVNVDVQFIVVVE